MKTIAMIVYEYGESAEFKKAEIELPNLENHQVLVEVSATSINAVDNKILRGVPFGPKLPTPLHGDLAGVVTEVGDKVSNFKPGDQVYGIAGGLANYGGASGNHMIVNEGLISHKPKTLTFAEAASLPLVFITAYEGLVEKAKLQESQSVLVIGGTGGVGHQAIQLAKLLGANVTATVSSDEKGEIAKSLGADNIINRNKVKLENYAKVAGFENGFDIVFDTVGGKNLENSWNLARDNGQIISTTSMDTLDLSPVHMKGLSLHVVFMLLPMITGKNQKRHQEILKFLTEKTDEGSIRTLVDNKIFDYSEINQAHSHFESGKHIGKVVLTNLEKLK